MFSAAEMFPRLSWKEWWADVENTCNNHRRLLLDVRTENEHRRLGLCCPSTSGTTTNTSRTVTIVHIPLSDLKDRLFELPPRRLPFAILMNLGDTHTETLDGHQTHLQQLEFALSIHSSIDSLSNKKRRPSCPRRIVGLIPADCEETWKEAAACGIKINKNNNVFLDQRQTRSFRPEPRLWQPDPLIEHVLLPLLKQQLAATAVPEGAAVHQLDHSAVLRQDSACPPVFEIWDLGSGVGRDVAFLAEELLSLCHDRGGRTTFTPFRVVGLDQRYRRAGVNETLAFWKRRFCESVTECRCIDLNDTKAVKTEFMAGIQGTANDDGTTTEKRRLATVMCLYAVRYWNRDLFELVAQLGRGQILEPGTIVAISQFGKPYVGASWEFAHPKEKHVLERNELSDLFRKARDSGSSSPWEILYDSVAQDSDQGRTLVQFVARLSQVPGPHIN